MKPSIEIAASDRETYERMAKAIAFMRENRCHQPDLETIARHVHLSKYHFQRLFTQWAGIGPKRFSQYLTVEYAKSKIAETKSLLDAAAETGLSGPGRLHDLFVTLEAMSPGEFKTGGAGLHIRYGVCETPFGRCAIATTTRGICNLYFLDEPDAQTVADRLRAQWQRAQLVCDRQMAEEMGDRIFRSFADRRVPLALHVKGTNFQIQVWRALLNVPFAGMTTYKGLAAAIGRPTAARAIGNAVGGNPVGYLIPCHRVIRESGELGGYRWGIERKTTLLGWEASCCDRDRPPRTNEA